VSLPYLTRTSPTYDILTEEQIIAVEEVAEKILQEIGVEVRHEPSLKLLKEAGLDVAGERVRFPHGYCRKLIVDNAPSRFIQHARNPEKSVEIGGNSLVLVPVYGPPFVAATDIDRRYGTLEDCNNFVRLAHMSPELHHTGGPICEPTDIPVAKRHLQKWALQAISCPVPIRWNAIKPLFTCQQMLIVSHSSNGVQKVG
jgi:trimethylamine--corrinoid protein Co-methyltransferase